MHIDHLNRAVLLIISLTIAILGDSRAQESVVHQGTASTNGLVVSVETVKDAYELGEKILLSVTVSNATHRAIKLMRTGGIVGTYRPVVKDHKGSALSLNAGGRAEQRVVKRPRARAQSMRLRFELGPMEATTFTVSLNKWLKIKEAGSYELTLFRNQMPTPAAAVASNTIKIGVVPKSEGEKGRGRQGQPESAD